MYKINDRLTLSCKPSPQTIGIPLRPERGIGLPELGDLTSKITKVSNLLKN